LKGESIAVKEMRKHMAWYLKGLTGSARIKDVLMEMTERDKMADVLTDYVAHLASEPSDPLQFESQNEAIYH
jgi:tRNA-dihydrouridine synthase